MKVLRDLFNVVDTAERKGIRKGKAEVAKKLLALGTDIKIVCQATGLSIDEISKL